MGDFFDETSKACQSLSVYRRSDSRCTSESDQTVNSRSLIKTFTDRILDSQGCKNFFRAGNGDSDQTAKTQSIN